MGPRQIGSVLFFSCLEAFLALIKPLNGQKDYLKFVNHLSFRAKQNFYAVLSSIHNNAQFRDSITSWYLVV